MERPLKNVHFCSRSRRARIWRFGFTSCNHRNTRSISRIAPVASRCAKPEPDTEIGQKGAFFKGLVERLPRHASIVLIAIVFTAGFNPAWAYENEPKEFRGINWGAPIGGVSDMVLVLDGGALKAYVRKGDEMAFGEARIDRIHYVFYKGRFYCVHVEFTGASNFNKMRKALVDWYGPGEERRSPEQSYYWIGGTASIALTYRESAERGEVGYKYMPLDAEIGVEERKR